MCWELARNPSWQDRLRAELQTCTPAKGETFPSFHDLDALPILDAVIQESLRLHPAAPGSLPRETPAGGRILDGYFVPENVKSFPER